MMQLRDLIEYLDGLLEIDRYQDYAPNGLQVEGRPTVRRLVAGVSASHALLEAAVAWDADAVLVHHGYFWRGESPCVVGVHRRRLQTLLENGVSLLAYHLPLDAHPRLGNNVQLAQRLDIRDVRVLDVPGSQGLVFEGRLDPAMTAEAFSSRLARRLGRPPLHLPGDDRLLNRVAWCSGGAQGYFRSVAEQGVDAYFTGEASEPMTHIASETGVHFFAAGHHATERYGVQALAAHLEQSHGLAWRYVELDNPV